MPSSGPCADRSSDDIFYVGVSAYSFGGVNANDAAAALKAWSSTVVKEQGLKNGYQVTLFTESQVEIRQAALENRLDALSCSVLDLIALDLKPEFVYLTSKDEDQAVRYMIVVHEDNDIEDLTELNQRNLVVGGSENMILSQYWLDFIRTAHSKGGIKLNQHKAPNASKAILQVFFRQTDAALVTAAAFEVACELNPQLHRSLKKIVQSPPLIHSVFVFIPKENQNEKHKAMIEKWENAIINLHQTPGGQQVLTVFKGERIEKHPYSILDSTINFLKNSKRLMLNTVAVPVEVQP